MTTCALFAVLAFTDCGDDNGNGTDPTDNTDTSVIVISGVITEDTTFYGD